MRRGAQLLGAMCAGLLALDCTAERQAEPLLSPSGTESSAQTVLVPLIDSITPSTIAVGPGEQSIQVSGRNFHPAAALDVLLPSGGVTTVSPARMQASGTTLTTTLVILDPGEYGLRVRHPNGQASNTVVVKATAPSTAPHVAAVSPVSLVAGPGEQQVTVSGGNFLSGLTVTVFAPNDTRATTLGGGQIQNVTPTSFQLSIVVQAPGTWGIRVDNPNGQQSNTLRFSVVAVSTSSPLITSVSPPSIAASASEQIVTVSGSNFQAGLAVTAVAPNNGGVSTLGGSRIRNVTATSFQMLIALPSPGVWSIRADNPNGQQSNTFQVTVTGSSASPPSIASVSPHALAAASTDQTLTVSGHNFQAGLSVTAFPPNTGAPITLTGSRIQNVTSTSFRVSIAVPSGGPWGIRVNNPSGQQSNTFPLTVTGGVSPPPLITALSPPSLVASATDQMVTVSGSNFQAGLTVTVVAPNGSASTVAGSPIQNVTSTSFRTPITATAAGTWSLRVNNPSGQQSNTFQLTVSSY